MNNYTWRFPDNGYGNETGIDDTGVETFKKDPVGALAREICQNSIDAQENIDIPVKLEFKTFSLNRNKIPGINRLSEEIKKCYEYKKDFEKEGKPLKFMLKESLKDKITCLRISDFNTKGLIGVSSNDKNSPFYLITKASGVSNKEGTSGGSKGIGKYAAFVNSKINTVFYSTYTSENEKGSLGVAILRSAPVSDNDPDLLSQGTGYFSNSIKNTANKYELNLDKNYERDCYGTDIYIIGFDDSQNWENEITLKILESFMGAIILNDLEVTVGERIINKETLPSIMEDKKLFNITRKKMVKEIKAQYELLTGKDVKEKNVDIEEYGQIKIIVKKYGKNDESKAMQRCVFIRYPYMRIKHLAKTSYLPYSAICIINNDEINKKLRLIENAQHTDWEIRRLDNYKEEKNITRKILNRIKEEVTKFIEEILIESSSESVNVESAAIYLPSVKDGETQTQRQEMNETRTTGKPKKVKINTNQKSFYDEDFNTMDFESGDIGIDDGDARNINHSNDESNPSDGEHEVNGQNNIIEGKNSILKKINLTGMSYKNIVLEKNKGIYEINFVSLYDKDNCELEVKLFGEGNDKYKLNILEATCNGTKCNIQNGNITNLKISKNNKYKITYIVDRNETFSSEVIMYAYR